MKSKGGDNIEGSKKSAWDAAEATFQQEKKMALLTGNTVTQPHSANICKKRCCT